jgi:hypothetical protein
MTLIEPLEPEADVPVIRDKSPELFVTVEPDVIETRPERVCEEPDDNVRGPDAAVTAAPVCTLMEPLAEEPLPLPVCRTAEPLEKPLEEDAVRRFSLPLASPALEPVVTLMEPPACDPEAPAEMATLPP